MLLRSSANVVFETVTLLVGMTTAKIGVTHRTSRVFDSRSEGLNGESAILRLSSIHVCVCDGAGWVGGWGVINKNQAE